MIANLPEKLRSLREKFGYSQKQVAQMLGVSASIISCYESGERTPSTEAILSLAYLFRCSTDFLLGRESTYTTSPLSTEGLSSEEIAVLQSVIETLRKRK